MEISTALGAYTVTVSGDVAVTDTGTGVSDFLIGASVAAVFSSLPIFDQGGGNVIVSGNVKYDNHTNTTGFDSVFVGGDSDEGAQARIGGDVTLKLANDAAHGNVVVLGYEEWYIQQYITAVTPETATGKSLIVYGALTVTSGAGADQFFIQGDWIAGLLRLNTGTNPTTGPADTVDIEGSEFLGGSDDSTNKYSDKYSNNQITMSGNNAVLYIADSHGSGWDPTVLEFGLTANMPGLYTQPASGDRIFLGGSDDGLTFKQNLYVFGTGPNINGTLFVDGPVTFLKDNLPVQPVLVFWQEG
jgi:hypothetical protein